MQSDCASQLGNLEKIVLSLEAGGMDPKTPACVIENGTLKNQREQVTTLDGLTSKGFAPPALVVIGDVVRFAKSREMAMTAKAA